MNLSPETYRDKVYGCWAGKCLAGAIGMPFEGVPFQPNLHPETIHAQDVPNDDLELQLVWLIALERYGLDLTPTHLSKFWMEDIQHGCDEYSIALRNMRRGIMPPVSGFNTLDLFTILRVSNTDTAPENVVLSATADVGMTLWMDRQRVMNHHSRQLAVPSFHRPEGGAAFAYPLQNGDRKLVHIKLYSCAAPLNCTLMFGNEFNDHLDGFKLDI